MGALRAPHIVHLFPFRNVQQGVSDVCALIGGCGCLTFFYFGWICGAQSCECAFSDTQYLTAL